MNALCMRFGFVPKPPPGTLRCKVVAFEEVVGSRRGTVAAHLTAYPYILKSFRADLGHIITDGPTLAITEEKHPRAPLIRLSSGHWISENMARILFDPRFYLQHGLTRFCHTHKGGHHVRDED